MFSCEICKIFKSTYFEEHLRTTASEPLPLQKKTKEKKEKAMYPKSRHQNNVFPFNGAFQAIVLKILRPKTFNWKLTIERKARESAQLIVDINVLQWSYLSFLKCFGKTKVNMTNPKNIFKNINIIPTCLYIHVPYPKTATGGVL